MAERTKADDEQTVKDGPRAKRGSDAPGRGERRSEDPPKPARSSHPPPNKKLPPPPDDGSADDGAKPRPLSVRLRPLLWVLLPVALFAIVFSVDRALYAERIHRSVFIGPVEVSGLTAEEARAALANHRGKLRTQPLTIVVRDARFELDPVEIAFELDVEQSLEEAFAVGRSGGALRQVSDWFGQMFGAREIVPTIRFDEAGARQRIAEWEREAIDDPPFEGGIRYEDGALRPEYPRPGWKIDADSALVRLREALEQGSGALVHLPVARQVPARDRAFVDEGLARAVAMTKAPVELVETQASFEARQKKMDVEGAEKKKDDEDAETAAPWRVTFDTNVLIGALHTEIPAEDDAPMGLTFEPQALTQTLDKLRDTLTDPAVDARFAIDKENKISIVPSRVGTKVDDAHVAESLREAALSADRRGVLPVEPGAEPEFSTEDAKALGISELVSEFTTYHPCCQPRVKNIHRIAELITGIVLKPGDTFSVNELIGERTLDKGFVDAPSIEDGEMVDTIGGGISQFATTLFNAVLHGGYEIIERQPHSLYFSRYPKGHEATLSFPKPDLIFKNDSDAGLLIHCEWGSKFIRVKIFGNNGGRKVDTEVSAPFDPVEPPIEYEANEEFEPDEEDVVEKGQDGWSVYATRTVTFPNGEEKKETRKVRYKPRPRVLEVHPCKIPEGEDGHTGDPCPEPEEEEDEDEDADAGGDDGRALGDGEDEAADDDAEG